MIVVQIQQKWKKTQWAFYRECRKRRKKVRLNFIPDTFIEDCG